ncbi:MAG: bifunctional diaminohydroxyphosphoribosylaminopyrimidine deaminase/5-amino-6-(5-phosphoribosylamino)uracil reductase RibD [Bacteroidia bacterium]
MAEGLSPLDEAHLWRAFWLARRAAPSLVEPNPPVGAILAIGEEILGEGFHARFGEAHAEIIALRQVKQPARLAEATLYVTLEPCCHTAKKTPPCVPAIVEAGIKRVVVGHLDPNPAVAGRGVAILQEAGLIVQVASSAIPFARLLRHFWVNVRYGRPYITLKWAQTAGPTGRFPFLGGLMGSRMQGRVAISGFWGKVWAHRLRAQHSHIAVGWRTWHLDRPALTTRYFPGHNPTPLVLYHPARSTTLSPPFYPAPQIDLDFAQALYQTHKVGSLLVEGGAHTLNQFLAADLWDEIHVIVAYRKVAVPSEAVVLAPTLPLFCSWQRLTLSPKEEVWIARRPQAKDGIALP